MKITRFEELQAWQKAMLLVEQVYRLQRQLPREELYGLGDQIRRAAISIPSNIAEGFGRESDGDFARFLSIANGSLCELRTQLMLAQRLGYFTIPDEIFSLHDEVGRLMRGLSTYLRKTKSTDQRPTTND